MRRRRDEPRGRRQPLRRVRAVAVRRRPRRHGQADDLAPPPARLVARRDVQPAARRDGRRLVAVRGGGRAACAVVAGVQEAVLLARVRRRGVVRRRGFRERLVLGVARALCAALVIDRDLIEPNIAGSGDPEASRGIESNKVFYDLWAPKPLIAAGGFTKETAIKAADEGRLVAFGRYYIANVRLFHFYGLQIVILSGS